jgi:hypothetical protein
MGGLQSNLDQIKIDIDKLNLITNNELFIKKTGFNIKFKIDKELGFIRKLFNKDFIRIKVRKF